MKTTTMQPSIQRVATLGALLVAGSLATACRETEARPPQPLEKLTAKRVKADLSKPDPNASIWNEVAAGTVALVAQPMLAPRPESTTTDSVTVQAVNDGKYVSFRLRWKDSELSEAGRLAQYSDAFALEFPQQPGTMPPVFMGAPKQPVQLYHWRAQYQRDELKGKPSITDLYPNAAIDMYQHEFKTAPGSSPELAEAYLPAKAVGNPQSYRKQAVDVVVAEGFFTSAVQENDGAAAKAEWKNGAWTLVITRPLVSPRGSVLEAGTPSVIAFAAWQGGKGEVGSRKSLTMNWLPFHIQ